MSTRITEHEVMPGKWFQREEEGFTRILSYDLKDMNLRYRVAYYHVNGKHLEPLPYKVVYYATWDDFTALEGVEGWVELKVQHARVPNDR